MPNWLFKLLGLTTDKRGTSTLTKTRTTTRTAVVLGVAGAAIVAAAAFTMTTALRQETGTVTPGPGVTAVTSITAQVGTVSNSNSNTNAPAGSMGCTIGFTKDSSSPSTIRISPTAQTIGYLRIENSGDVPCNFERATVSGNLIATNSGSIGARRITFLKDALILGQANTGSATTGAGSNYTAAYRVGITKGSGKLSIPAHGAVIWRITVPTSGMPKALTLDLTVSLNTSPGGDIDGGKSESFRVRTTTPI